MHANVECVSDDRYSNADDSDSRYAKHNASDDRFAKLIPARIACSSQR